MIHYKYVIIGQGLAGTILSMRLEERGIPHLVVDQPELSHSSKIAAGLANPIVLKRMKWVKGADLFLPKLELFYKNWEEKLSALFYHPIALRHIFNSYGNINQWQEKSVQPLFKNHLGPYYEEALEFLYTPYGYGLLKNIFWVNTEAFLNAYRKYLKHRGQYLQCNIGFENGYLTNLPEDIQYSQALLCSGHLARSQFPCLNSIFTPTRGEVIIVEAPNLNNNEAWHKGVFALPLGNNLFKVGATYAHEPLEDQKTSAGLEKLKQEFEKIYSGPYTVKEHHAGVRPNIKDRKPILGALSSRLSIFNGLGSRGVLMAPYLAKVMVDNLESQKKIPRHWNINRFT